MATVYEVRDEMQKSMQVNPMAVALGATDQYVEWLRKEMPVDVHYKGTMQTVAALMSIPRRSIEWSLDMAVRSLVAYEELGERGEKLAKRISRQAATKKLVEQAQYTVSAGKGAVTPYVKAAEKIEEDNEATVTDAVNTGRRAAKTIYQQMVDQAQADWDEWNEAAENSRSRFKATVTSARNTIKAGREAAVKAVEKIGD